MDFTNLMNRKILHKLGYKLINTKRINEPDLEEEFLEIYKKCKPFTMTSIERMYGLYTSIKYIIQNNIPGDLVECGVWKGGSTMLMAYTLKMLGKTDRQIFMYDTYEGMSAPTGADITIEGKDAKNTWEEKATNTHNDWCYASLDEVKKNLSDTGYPMEKILFIKGKVEDTIPDTSPLNISLLRLDTDWYESTYHEMKYLFPLLALKGILILDDYGHWKGAREAVDKYFMESHFSPLFFRMDYSGRIMIKINNDN